jgi:predicted hydrocarbon binding protein
MDRKAFLKCCATAACSCVVPGSHQEHALLAQSGDRVPLSDQEKEDLKWKLNAVQVRFAKLVNILNDILDQPEKKKVLQRLGGECAQSYRDLVEKYKGNLMGFLDHVQKAWVEKVEYDEKAGTIRIVDKARQCTCPFVKQGITPKDFCNCTLGWQKATYSALLGRPVEAEIGESILRGGTQCIFRIRIL